MNSNLMLVAGHLSPLHSKTGLKMTKATIYGGSFLRRAKGLQEAADFVSCSTRWQKCGLLLAATVRLDGILLRLPSDMKNVHTSIYSLSKSLYKSPVRWFFSGSNVPSNLLIGLFKVRVCSCLCDSSGTRGHFKM